MEPVATRYVVTSPLSLARVMWWYGEDDAGPQRSSSTAGRGGRPRAAVRRAPRRSRDVQLLWPGAPVADAHLVLGTIEHLEGRPRPAARRHRRGGPMPDRLDRDEDERWRDPALAEVFRLVQERTGSPLDGPQPWQLPRLRGRYATG